MKPALCLTAASLALCSTLTEASLADRSRVVKARGGPHRDNGRAIEGPKYRNSRWSDARDSLVNRKADERRSSQQSSTQMKSQPIGKADDMSGGKIGAESTNRDLGQLTGCCSNYQSYYAADMCGLYGQDCEEGGGSGDNGSGDEDCSMEGLSFVGISFSVNTANGEFFQIKSAISA